MRQGGKHRLSSTALGRWPSPAVLGLLVGLGIVTAMAGFAYRHMASLDEMERWVAHTREVLDAIQAGATWRTCWRACPAPHRLPARPHTALDAARAQRSRRTPAIVTHVVV